MSYPNALYQGEKGESSGTLRTADTTPEMSIGGRTNVHYLATGATTGGQFGLYR